MQPNREHSELFPKSCEGLVWAPLKSWGLMRAEDASAPPPSSSESRLSAGTISLILAWAAPQVCPCPPCPWLPWPTDGISWPDHRWPHGYGLVRWQRGLGWAHYSPILAPRVRSGSALALPDGDVTGIYSFFLEWVVLCHLDKLRGALQHLVVLVEKVATSHTISVFEIVG